MPWRPHQQPRFDGHSFPRTSPVSLRRGRAASPMATTPRLPTRPGRSPATAISATTPMTGQPGQHADAGVNLEPTWLGTIVSVYRTRNAPRHRACAHRPDQMCLVSRPDRRRPAMRSAPASGAMASPHSTTSWPTRMAMASSLARSCLDPAIPAHSPTAGVVTAIAASPWRHQAAAPASLSPYDQQLDRHRRHRQFNYTQAA